MSTLTDTLKYFLEQQIEIYGDEKIAGKDLFIYKNKIESLKKTITAESLDTVYMEGDSSADILIVMDAFFSGNIQPHGSVFTGPAGELLVNILKAINVSFKSVFVCLLPGGADETCNVHSPVYLQAMQQITTQIEIVNPAFILCMGKNAGQYFSKSHNDIDTMHGIVTDYQRAQVIVTYHPEMLLNNIPLKKITWQDVQVLQRLYEQWKNNQKTVNDFNE